MESKRDDVENVIKLVVSFAKDGYGGGITLKSTSSATSDHRRHHRRRVYEFHSDHANVTPREIISARYPMKQCRGMLCKHRALSTTHTYGLSPRNYDDYFLKINLKSVDDLLDDVLSYRRPRFGGEEAYETRYDVGPDIVDPFPAENAIANGRVIELTESPTFHILNVPNTVTVEGDGDYERIRKTNDVYRNNCARTRAIADTVTQTVNAPADRKDKKCQTSARPAGRTVGAQLDGFDVVDEIDGNERRASAAAGTSSTGDFARTAMFVVRIAAQNAMMMDARRTESREETPPPSARVRLDYRFTLTRNDGDGLAVSCTHWNEAETDLLAVAYSEPDRDDRDDVPTNAAAAVAVWNTKNPYAPERFYEFDKSVAITCLRFSTEYPNHLAVGFDSGEVLIIDISNERLEIIFRKSKQSPLEIHGIRGLFWTVRLESGLSQVDQFECLVTCNSRAGIDRYRYWNETFERKTICENDGVAENDEQPPMSSNAKKYSKSICHATTFHRLDQRTYLVGTGDGSVYTCTYDNLRCYSTKTIAHFGVIKSLDKSPYSPDVYLTTGCDCTVKIWMGDIFVEPVITLGADGQIEKAIWSRTNPTVIVSIVDNRLHVWDIDETTDAPVAVRELRASGRACCSDAEFTSDGRHLCVSDTDGNVVVYAWSDASSSSVRQTRRHCSLMLCVARSLYSKPYLTNMLSKQRPEYADVFAAVYDER